MRARCLQAEGTGANPTAGGGFVFGFTTGSVQYDFGLTPTQVFTLQPGGTGGANARGEVAAYRFIQDVATPTRPASWGRVKGLYR